MMYLAPELVRTEMIPTETGFKAVPYHKYPIIRGMVPESGALASAKGSSAEKGKLITDTAVDEFVKIIEKYGENAADEVYNYVKEMKDAVR